ncbi:uncharacterized protein TRAVEDRAFT_53973 [Trametes versicolor FP-101664 SS1]|uniref:Uncharacterized protein n=1 Tax=Trametes versicolor (strain FP-101664) TaxID=717944 RepID=R7SAJ7_TRAVS|nr:uncharacterized protein TRAVEDRAFT_53973 [Trametes versicolor FP-101664 SS1]EIW51989.1 hypothetical protein TRAVEDRAFT_53973 [Trametes versicolor FP-101664 SS1]
MSFYLKHRNFKVMASIFKISTGDRHSIRWEDFVHTMSALGFRYSTNKGSQRTFKPRRSELKPNFRCHEERQLDAYRQDVIAPKLTAHFGWTASSFKLKQ